MRRDGGRGQSSSYVAGAGLGRIRRCQHSSVSHAAAGQGGLLPVEKTRRAWSVTRVSTMIPVAPRRCNHRPPILELSCTALLPFDRPQQLPFPLHRACRQHVGPMAPQASSVRGALPPAPPSAAGTGRHGGARASETETETGHDAMMRVGTACCGTSHRFVPQDVHCAA